jgi:4-hydroxybenzoate polyprenyltransferase
MRKLSGYWTLVHPGPSLLTVAAFALCAFIAAGGQPAIGKLLVASLGMVCQQFAISALNDYCDRAADARSSHKRKPIVLGVVTPTEALVVTAICIVGMFLCFAPFGFVAVGLASVFLALGFAYDLGVKSTPISGVMHGLAFPTIPLLAWSIFAHISPALLWVLPLGMALGIGLHLADAIPDADADAAAGVRGLTQTLGRNALAVCWSAFALAVVIIALLAWGRITPARLPWLLGLELLAAGLLFAAIISYRQQSVLRATRLKRNFLWLVAVAFVIVVGFFTAITV